MFSYDEIALITADHASKSIQYLTHFRDEEANPILLVQAFSALERARLVLVSAIEAFPPEIAAEVKAWMEDEEAGGAGRWVEEEPQEELPYTRQGRQQVQQQPVHYDCQHCEDEGCPACSQSHFLEMQRQQAHFFETQQQEFIQAQQDLAAQHLQRLQELEAKEVALALREKELLAKQVSQGIAQDSFILPTIVPEYPILPVEGTFTLEHNHTMVNEPEMDEEGLLPVPITTPPGA